jgi:acyl carrier protein
VGELCLGGRGQSRGYLGRPARTAERYVPDPFGPPGARLYRTGDLARWLPDGRLAFLGRRDYQVKVRGYRIELGEIEAALVAHSGVREAVAVVLPGREDGDGPPRLVAYTVPASPDRPPPAAELRAHLSERLPGYMVPATFVSLAALPLTPNGKIDRRALPVPEGDREAAGGEFVAPRTPAEERVAAIWRELLAVDRVGVHNDFFALGGHSLLVVQVVSRVRRAFDVDLPDRSLFLAPTVAGLTAEVERAAAGRAGAASAIVKETRAARRRKQSTVARPG